MKSWNANWSDNSFFCVNNSWKCWPTSAQRWTKVLITECDTNISSLIYLIYDAIRLFLLATFFFHWIYIVVIFLAWIKFGKKGGCWELHIRVGAHSTPLLQSHCGPFLAVSFLYHPWSMYTMKDHVALEHSSTKNVDLVFIHSFELQAWIFNSQIFGQVWYFLSKYSESCQKLTLKNITLNTFVNGHKWSWFQIQMIQLILNLYFWQNLQ